jgi:hypothetical protein
MVWAKAAKMCKNTSYETTQEQKSRIFGVKDK